MAISALFVQWILATYFFPFYVYIAAGELDVVAVHFGIVMGASAICSLASHEVC